MEPVFEEEGRLDRFFRRDLTEKLRHNCDTKRVFTAKTDFIDKLRSLILRSLLNRRGRSKFPAYRLARAQGCRSL